MDNSFIGSSMLLDHSDVSFSGDSSSNLTLSKAGFSVPMSGQSRGVPFTLDTITATYNPASHNEWPQDNQSQAGYLSTCVKQEPLSIPVQESVLTLQASTSSLLQLPPPYRTDKTVDLNLVKQEQKEAGGSGPSKHHPAPQSVYPPPVQLPQPQPSIQKLTLGKYREKHSAELTLPVHKRRQELHGGLMDCDMKGDLASSSIYAPSSITQVDHRKHVQPHQSSHSGNITASPMKMKVPSSSVSGQDRRHHSDKRDKGSLKVRPAVPGSSGSSQPEKSGQPSKDELKMKLKVSSERHSSSDEGMTANNNKTKHSSPLVIKEKHRGAEYNLHRPHKHGHPPTHSGNGRGGTEAPGGAGLLRGPPSLVPMEGTFSHPVPTLTSSSSRKRAHPEAAFNHHLSSATSSSCSKVSKISKGGAGAAGTLSFSSPLSPCSSPVLQCVSSDSQHCG